MYILVFSIMAKLGYAGGVTITQIGPFANYAACAKAGELLVKQQADGKRYMYNDARWSCVKDR